MKMTGSDHISLHAAILTIYFTIEQEIKGQLGKGASG